MTFGAVGPAFYDFLVAHGVDDPFDTWFLLYVGWWVVFLLFFFGPLSWVVLRPPPTSAAAAVPPPATLSDDQAARLEAAAGGAAKVDGVFATDGRWFEVTVDWEGVPRAHASGARAAKKEEKLRFVARKAVELREALPRAGQESEIPNFKASYLGRFPLVSADFWTSDHLLDWSRSVDAFSGTRARGTLTLKRR